MTDQTKEPGILVKQVFLNKALFEHSPASNELPSNTPVGDHALTVTLNTGVSDDGTEGVVGITVQTTEENIGCYRFIAEMVLIVGVHAGSENMPIADYMASGGGPTLFPFLRECVANLTGRGRFGPLWLRPINFVQLAEQLTAQQHE